MVTVPVGILQAVSEDRASLDSVELYANLSEKMRGFVEDYFQMQTPLYVSYIHLVCRTSLLSKLTSLYVSYIHLVCRTTLLSKLLNIREPITLRLVH